MGVFGDLVGAAADIAMVLMPPAGFVAQLLKMRKVKSSEGFSKLVPLILLVSNALRIAFWIGKRFSLVLVFQSLVMTAAQLVLLYESVRLRKAGTGAARPKTFAEFVEHFWEWSDFGMYIVTAAAFWFACIVPAMALQNVAIFVEFLGVASLAIEASLGVPQWLRNRRHGSTAGLSLVLILTWFAGDAFKAAYFASTGSPMQFLACALFQLIVDLGILWQFATLPGSTVPRLP